jgi:membrane protein YqaA with SNARE-associated domain
VHIVLFCTVTNKCTVISQIITILHVATLSCHPQGACNYYLAKLLKYFKCSCW